MVNLSFVLVIGYLNFDFKFYEHFYEKFVVSIMDVPGEYAVEQINCLTANYAISNLLLN